MFFVFVCSGYLGAQFRLRRELPSTRVVQFSVRPAQNDTKSAETAPTTLHQGFKFCLRRKPPHRRGGGYCVYPARRANLT